MIIGKLQYNNSFSEVERELAQYILEHPESVVEMNIRQLAQMGIRDRSCVPGGGRRRPHRPC